MDWIRRRGRGRPPHPDILTPAEWRVLEHARDGWSNAEIAERLGITVPTVKTHMSRILAKLELPDRGALATWQGEPAPEAPRRSSAAAPLGWLTSKLAGSIAAVALAGTLVAAVLVGMESGRATGDASPTLAAATSTSSPTEPAQAVPLGEAAVTSLAQVYDPQQFGSPTISSTCCLAMWYPTRIAPPSLDAANAEGELYLENVRSDAPFPAVFEGVPGTDALRCVDTRAGEGGSRVRSGDFMIDLSSWTAPDHALLVFPRLIYDQGLFLRATKLGAAKEPATHVHELSADPGVEPESGVSFFSATFILPEPGEWLVIATAGSQWGCFIVDAPTPPEEAVPSTSVAEAEMRGEFYPSEPAPEYVSPGFLADRGPNVPRNESGWTLRGSANRACLDITGAHDARSGEWIIRPAWSSFTDANPRSPGTKMLFIPRHQPPTMAEARAWERSHRQQVRATATLLNAPQHTYVYEHSGWNARTGGESQGTIEFQHVSGMVMPRDEGDWLVVVTDGIGGSQWGCFVAPDNLPVAYP